jgi:NAD(P)-dependent dehydrogenase (short-subunit alcohol dehydrogenase family)
MTGELLSGRVAAVTGGARGLGAAIVRAFEAAGATTYTLDLAVGTGPLSSTFLACDVSDEPSVAAAFRKIRDTHGRVDVVVANAGLVPPWRTTDALDLEEWDRVFAVNVRGVATTFKHAVPAMKESGGSMIAMGSINSFAAHPQQALYTATKHAVLGLVRAAARDLGRYHIRVNALGPGPVATEALMQRLEQRAASGGLPVEKALMQHAEDTPLGRIATEEDVSRAAVFLASDLSSGITGRLIPVDCGLT